MRGRPNRETTLLGTAYLWADRSTCARLKVGCVISRDGRILVQGYNGAPAGMPHCDYPHEPEDCLAVHAEANAIAFAARWGVMLEGAMLTCTHQPCLNCARLIINAGISRVIFSEPYRLKDGLRLLQEAGIEVLKFHAESDKI
jgi:dCMP deaminase